ncbi:MAG: transcriptional regulator [Acidithiobacillales bacterium SG8_45]|jgi:DNA-binding transcriptional LysR family regulator|nr:MAG: transcriptional regulator [Acidithiobacillales bacterium SG8_45]
MHLTLRQLKVFESVARNLGYTRAAEELHLTQPAVSMQIKQLEDSVGLPLFEKMGKKIYLTEAGRELYGYSSSISRQLDEVDEIIESLKGLERGRLAISVASTANSFATRLLAAFSKDHPGVTVSLDVTNRRGLLNQLANNEADLVIMGRPPRELDLATEAFMDNPLVVIAPKGHPLGKERDIPLARLQEETFVVRELGSGTRNAMERFFTEQGIRLTTGMEMTSNEAIKQAVEAGLGLGIVSIHTLELEMETRRICVLDAENFPILRHWYVVHRRGKRLSPAAQAFKDYVLAEGDKIMPTLMTFGNPRIETSEVEK